MKAYIKPATQVRDLQTEALMALSIVAGKDADPTLDVEAREESWFSTDDLWR